MFKTFACLFLDFSVDNTFKCVHTEVTANDEVSGSKTLEKLLSHLEEFLLFNI